MNENIAARPMADRPLEGATALITGASSGIGAATARALAARGAAIAMVARRRERLEEIADEVSRGGGRAFALEADITERADGVVQDAVERLGRLDVLVNNAGIMLLGPASAAALTDWERMVRLNVSALLQVTHAAIPYLIDAAASSPRRVADLVNISSTAGRVARPGGGVYSLTKFGVTGFAESLRQELLSERVRVSVIEPGTVDTELVEHLGDGVREAAQRQVGSIEPLRPDDVADVVAYVVTRDRRVAVNEVLVRAGEQTW